MKNKIPKATPKSAVEFAQDIMYEAWEAESEKDRVKLAKEALSISSDCADAYNLLAEEDAGTFEEAKDLYQKGVEAGRRALGEKIFKEEAGHFWGYLPARPYLRSRVGLMECLWELGGHDEAIGHAREMLELNRNDNQGIRYILIAYLAELGRYDELEKFMKKSGYKNDCAGEWLYTKALLRFVKEGDSEGARKELRIALGANKYVPEYLIGKKPIPRVLPDRITMGGEDEGYCYAWRYEKAWKKVPKAIDWLMERSGVKVIPKTGRNEPCPCGSGKKFKKCCGFDCAPMPEDLKTDTKLDFYFGIFQSVMIYAEMLKTNPKFGGELRRLCYDFEERFKPGEEQGLPDSFYLNWFVFDNRFGVDQRTIIERMMEEKDFHSMPEPVKFAARELSDSYATCYQVKEIRKKNILFEELVTGRQWIVHRIGDPCDEEAKPQDIWHARFVGCQEDAYYFGQPFVFKPEAKVDFIKITEGLIKKFKEYASTRSLKFVIPRDAFKAGISFWSEYLYRSFQGAVAGSDAETESGRSASFFSTTDDEELRKFEEEQRRIYSDSEVKEVLIQKQQEYYLKDWIFSKIPALNNKTPLQAVKTKEGRLQLEVLINRIEIRSSALPDYLPKMDMNFLRQKLGLSPADRG